jgi:hypothetical protein
MQAASRFDYKSLRARYRNGTNVFCCATSRQTSSSRRQITNEVWAMQHEMPALALQSFGQIVKGRAVHLGYLARAVRPTLYSVVAYRFCLLLRGVATVNPQLRASDER